MGENRQIIFTLKNCSLANTVKFQWPSLPCLSFTPSIGHIKPGTAKDIAVVFKVQGKPQSLAAQKISGRLCKVSFSQPLPQIPDWDDRMKSVRWVNNAPVQPPSEMMTDDRVLQSTLPKPIVGPAKKKIVETDPEPACSIVEDSNRHLELLISAVANYARYECDVKEIKFKDTLMYQSKVYIFSVRNTGLIPFTYEWVVTDDPDANITKEVPFSITPSNGEIQSESEESFTLMFSPLDVLSTQCFLSCMYVHTY